ncbi:MAG: hypothetical protein U0599_28515 [Vicinamibacteria bacterium]
MRRDHAAAASSIVSESSGQVGRLLPEDAAGVGQLRLQQQRLVLQAAPGKLR